VFDVTYIYIDAVYYCMAQHLVVDASPVATTSQGVGPSFAKRVKLTVYVEPEFKEWLDVQIDNRTWASYSHAFNWLFAWFRKKYGKKPFKVVWFPAK